MSQLYYMIAIALSLASSAQSTPEFVNVAPSFRINKNGEFVMYGVVQDEVSIKLGVLGFGQLTQVQLDKLKEVLKRRSSGVDGTIIDRAFDEVTRKHAEVRLEESAEKIKARFLKQAVLAICKVEEEGEKMLVNKQYWEANIEKNIASSTPDAQSILGLAKEMAAACESQIMDLQALLEASKKTVAALRLVDFVEGSNQRLKTAAQYQGIVEKKIEEVSKMFGLLYDAVSESNVEKLAAMLPALLLAAAAE